MKKLFTITTIVNVQAIFPGHKIQSQLPFGLYSEDKAHLYTCADEGGQCECDGTVYYIKQPT